jgi:hypothetical protein
MSAACRFLRTCLSTVPSSYLLASPAPISVQKRLSLTPQPPAATICPGMPNGCVEHHRAALKSITSAVPMNLGNQYQNYLFIRSTDCKARPFGTNWQARYSDEEPYMYSASTPGDFSGEILANLREQMEPGPFRSSPKGRALET